MIYDRDDSLYSVFSQVIRLHHRRSHAFLEKMGIYPGQPPLLFSLLRKNGQSQKELAERLHVQAATVTVMLGRMEKTGLIERRQDENDQRVSRVYLTERGKMFCEELRETMKSFNRECFKNFTDEEQILLRRFFMQIRDNLMDKNHHHFSGSE